MKNREIKFRVWIGTKMEYNVMVGFLGAFYVQGIDPNDKASMSPANTIYSDLVPVMQYTGLKDKNGKEIYEGDILRSLYGYKSNKPLVVFWEHGFFSLRNERIATSVSFEKVLLQDFEVIGNIYENPELLHTKD